MFVYIACGGERALVADRAVAAKLMSGVLSALGGAASEGVSLADVLDDIFGEDVAESSKSLIA